MLKKINRYAAIAWKNKYYILTHLPSVLRFFYMRDLRHYSPEKLSARGREALETVGENARKIYGEDWNFYSNTLRPEVIDVFEKAIQAVSIEKNKPLAYLEIGSCQGVSMAVMGVLLKLYGKPSRLLSMDPYFEGGYVEGQRAPVPDRKRIWVDKKTRDGAFRLYRSLDLDVRLIEKPSAEGLCELVRAEEKFDLVYIDGNHERLNPAVDFGLSCTLLNKGGVLMLDDYLWPDVHAVKKICDRHSEKICQTWKTAVYRIRLDVSDPATGT